MNQNIIVLVLLVLAILVSFYSAYLALDSSRKVYKLQDEIKNSLGLINENLNMSINENKNKPGGDENLNNENLDEFPNLKDLEKLNKNLNPLPQTVKNELENIYLDTLDKNRNIDKYRENGENNNMNSELHRESYNLENVILDNNQEDNNQEDNKEDDKEDDNSVEDNQEDDKEDDNPVEDNQEDNQEDNKEDDNKEDDNQEDDKEDDNQEDDNNDDNQEDDNNDDVGDLVGSMEDEIKMEEIEIKSKEKTEYLVLDEITNDYLNNLTDKQIKDICRREDLRLRGNKIDRVNRIIKKKEFNIKI